MNSVSRSQAKLRRVISMYSATILTLLCTAAVALCCQSTRALETEVDPMDPALDIQLLDDLDSDLLNDLELRPKTSADSSREADKQKRLPKEDLERGTASGEKQDEEEKSTNLDQIGAGEDIDFDRSPDPLTRIGQRMRTAKSWIDRRDTSTQTQQLQGEILDDLAALIAKLQSQQRRQESGGDPSNQGRFQAGEGDGASAAQSNVGSEKSTDRVGQSDTTLTALRRQQELLRRMNWGSLPDRLRDQVRSSRVEQFLPKYARLIEQYYKRLAEESQYQP